MAYKATSKTGLTFYSIAVAVRVVRQIQVRVKGTNAQADVAFEMVSRIMEAMMQSEK